MLRSQDFADEALSAKRKRLFLARRRLSSGFQKPHQQSEPFAAEVAQLPAVHGTHGLVQFLEQLEPFGADPHANDPPILALAATADQLALFEAIEQARHVRVAGNHPLAD